MSLDEILQSIHAAEDYVRKFERKYNVRSQTFYDSYMNGDEPPDWASIGDWALWAGAYETLLERQQQYTQGLRLMQQQTPLSVIIEKAARREPIQLAA